jgi:hypothetical protein
VYYGLDFGANVWGSHLGVSTRRPAVERDFARMAALGFRVARWFVFCDGRSGIVFDEWGMPSGLDSHVFADLDAALEIARQAGIRLDLVLLDHRWMFSGLRDTIPDPVTGALLEARLPSGRARVLVSGAGRDALFESVLLPIVHRYGAGGARADLADQVFAFELMNEPDFVVEEWERDLSSRVTHPVPFEGLAGLVSKLSDAVHACSPAFTTIGCARVHNLWAWDDDSLGLDVLQIHSYPDLRFPGRDANVFGRPAHALGVSRRLILGEFPGDARVRGQQRISGRLAMELQRDRPVWIPARGAIAALCGPLPRAGQSACAGVRRCRGPELSPPCVTPSPGASRRSRARCRRRPRRGA